MFYTQHDMIEYCYKCSTHYMKNIKLVSYLSMQHESLVFQWHVVQFLETQFSNQWV
jgi:hypothetical protein